MDTKREIKKRVETRQKETDHGDNQDQNTRARLGVATMRLGEMEIDKTAMQMELRRMGEQLNEVFPGDEYNPKTGRIISRPENHASLPEELIIQAKITEEMKAIAIERLVQRGEIPSDYIDRISQKEK